MHKNKLSLNALLNSDSERCGRITVVPPNYSFKALALKSVELLVIKCDIRVELHCSDIEQCVTCRIDSVAAEVSE